MTRLMNQILDHNKSAIRRLIKEKKSQMTIDQIEEQSKAIIRKVLALKEYKECSILYTYVAFNQEVRTKELIEIALNQGKKVAVPKVEGDKIIFYYLNHIQDLKNSNLDIPEPIFRDIAIPNTKDKFLMIVPGLAFDIYGNRIGYGKAYYDSFFHEYENIPMYKVSFAYEFQLFEELPMESHDVKMDQIITV